MSKRCYYEVLGVTKTSTSVEIKKSYRKAAVEHHPDKNPDDPEAEDRFKEIGEAYEVLADDDKRAAYDRFGHSAFSGGGGPSRGAGGFHDPFEVFREVFGGGGGGGGGGIFDELFGGGGGRRRGGGANNRGSDLRYDLQITLEEAAIGCDKELELEKGAPCGECDGSGSDGGGTSSCATCGGHGQVISSRGFFQVQQTCPECRGSGEVIDSPCSDCGGEGRVAELTRVKLKIPAGIDHGSRIRSTGDGEAGRRGGAAGDLYVVIHIKEHDVFEREENDLFCDVPISFATAALGGELEVPTLEGKASIKIPPSTQNGTVFRLRDRGIPFLNSSRKGDLHVQVQVEVPTKLNKEQREKLGDFADSIGEKNSPIHETFFEKAKRFFK